MRGSKDVQNVQTTIVTRTNQFGPDVALPNTRNSFARNLPKASLSVTVPSEHTFAYLGRKYVQAHVQNQRNAMFPDSIARRLVVLHCLPTTVCGRHIFQQERHYKNSIPSLVDFNMFNYKNLLFLKHSLLENKCTNTWLSRGLSKTSDVKFEPNFL